MRYSHENFASVLHKRRRNKNACDLVVANLFQIHTYKNEATSEKKIQGSDFF